jgi:tRNA(Ile)-lysidine synthase
MHLINIYNKIRHDLVPLLKELNPYFIPSFQKTQSHLQESQAMVEDLLWCTSK